MAGIPDHKQDEVGLGDPMVRFHSFLHGGTSSLLSTLPTLIVFPVYKTVFRQQIHNTAVHLAVEQLFKEGPVKLYRGVAPPLLMKTLNGTLLFGLQDTLVHQFSLSSQNTISTSALAGFGAGTIKIGQSCSTLLPRRKKILGKNLSSAGTFLCGVCMFSPCLHGSP